MKKKVPMICNIVSVVLVIAFIVKNVVDYSKYTSTLNSAPFYVWILANALYLSKRKIASTCSKSSDVR